MSVEGNLDLFQLPEILQLIAQQQKTGILTVQGVQDIVAISFLHGKIVAADALNQSAEDGLKSVLVGSGLLSAADFARAAAEQATSGQRMLDLLVERRFVSRPRLLEALRVQTRQLLEKLLDWREGDFKFYSGDEVAYEEGFVPIRVDELLLHAADHRRPVTEDKAAAPAAPARPTPVPSAAPLRAPAPAEATPARPAENLRPVVVPFPTLEPALPGIRQMTLEPSPVPPVYRHIGRILAGGALLVVIFALLLAPHRALSPFFWQDPRPLGDLQRMALYLKIERAAKTFFLLEGRFPDRLSQLRDLGLLTRSDSFDGEGHALSFTARERGYELRSIAAGGRALDQSETTGGILGNFLLDPEFLVLRPRDAGAPLVLLD